MKLATNTYLCEWLGEDKALELIKGAGFDGVDLSLFEHPGDRKLLGDGYRERAKAFKEKLAGLGLACVQSHAPYRHFQYGMAMDISEPMFLETVQAMEFAAIVGARHIVVHGILVPDGLRTYASMEYNYKFYKALEPYAKEFGIRIALENLGECCPNPYMMSELLRMLDDPTFVALIDTGHARLLRTSAAKFLRAMTPGTVQGLHVQDNMGSKDDHLLPYIGTSDWDEIAHALADIDYQGDFTFEAGNFLKPFKDDEESMAAALLLMRKVGRRIMAKIEEYRAGKDC